MSTSKKYVLVALVIATFILLEWTSVFFLR